MNIPAGTATLVMTALMDEGAFAQFDGLRKLHFPPDRNIVPAHISVFHALPGHAAEIIADATHQALSLGPDGHAVAAGIRFLGRGVAYTVEAPGLTAVRATIAAACAEWLTPQDQQSFRPHVTIQNKVDPDAARALFQTLSREFQPTRFTLKGLRLWVYENGPWSEAATFAWPYAPASL